MDQEKYQHVQMLDYQVKQLQKILESIDAQLSEIHDTVEALRAYGKLEKDGEILFPITNGIFAKGKLIDNKTLSINIGSNVVVEKSIPDTISMMEKQAKDIESYKSEVTTQLQKFMEKIGELEG
jgi:prefoldin alpha subunit